MNHSPVEHKPPCLLTLIYCALTKRPTCNRHRRQKISSVQALRWDITLQILGELDDDLD